MKSSEKKIRADQPKPTHRPAQILLEGKLSNGSRLRLYKGNVIWQEVDAIVNAANSALKLGGGLAGVIREEGGDSIQVECDQWVRANGQASPQHPGVTGAGKLPAKKIIHAVAPVWTGGLNNEPQELMDAYFFSLDVASKLNLSSIAFPSLGTGIFRNPLELGAQSARGAAEYWARNNPTAALVDVRFVLWDQNTVDAFIKAFKEVSD